MIAFDMDETLFQGAPRGEEWMDQAAIREKTSPRWDICHAVQAMEIPPVVVTGRTSYIYDVTEAQLLEVFGEVELYTRPLTVPFAGLAEWKAETLRMLGCTLYVGDSAVDREAADLAGALHCTPEVFHSWAEKQVEYQRVIA